MGNTKLPQLPKPEYADWASMALTQAGQYADGSRLVVCAALCSWVRLGSVCSIVQLGHGWPCAGGKWMQCVMDVNKKVWALEVLTLTAGSKMKTFKQAADVCTPLHPRYALSTPSLLPPCRP